MADTVRKAVSEGEYTSASEVVRDALRLWQQRRHPHDLDTDVLRRRWDEGQASGRAGPLDMKRILAEERAAFEDVPTGVTELLVSRHADGSWNGQNAMLEAASLAGSKMTLNKRSLGRSESGG